MEIWEGDVRRLHSSLAALVTVIGITAACGGGSTPPPAANTSTTAPSASAPSNASTDKNSYPVFTNPDSGADASVPAEKGGKGFKGEGWETNTDFDLIGDPKAVKGGELKHGNMSDFPSTLRYYGPNITAWNQMVNAMVYETLLGLHPTTLDYVPALATHWQISADKMTFRFRIDPNARFSDGTPVTSEDVVATWKLLTDKSLQDPAQTLIYSNFEQPVAESKYLLSVKAKTQNWQNLLYFGNSMLILPAHLLKSVNGAAYIRDYNYKMMPGSGPYVISEQDVNKGNSVRIRKRNDYWAEKDRRNVGLNNFATINQQVVRDENLEFERVKRGDLDLFVLTRAQQWVQELNYPNIKRGLNQKRKIFNNNPNGIQGVAMNTRREPYNDVRVRKALRHLFNRELMIQKLAFNEYFPMDSMYFGSVYENPGNEKIKYDPQKALQLLGEAGWKDRDSAGRLSRNGQPLTLELVYGTPGFERYFTVYQEDLRKLGITLNLRLVTWETLIKLLDDQAYQMALINYTGEPFPNPRANLHSSLADQKNNNNITGFKNKRADEIMDAYEKEFDTANRVKLLRELDGIFTSEHHYIFMWGAPFQRLVFWNKFGYPQGVVTRIGDYRDVPTVWWLDPEKSRKLEAAMKDPSINLGEGPSDDKYWVEYGKREAQSQAASR
jgi:microcin C transport system substrate-binding protein